MSNVSAGSNQVDVAPKPRELSAAYSLVAPTSDKLRPAPVVNRPLAPRTTSPLVVTSSESARPMTFRSLRFVDARTAPNRSSASAGAKAATRPVRMRESVSPAVSKPLDLA